MMVENQHIANKETKRKSRRFILLKVLLGAILLAGLFLLRTAFIAGEFKRLSPHFSGSIRPIQGIVGGEDITIDHVARIAYISADDRYARASGAENPVGAIYSLNLAVADAEPVLLQRIPDEPIAPHGISLVSSNDTGQYLYVVDHIGRNDSKRNAHRILLYSIDSANNQLKLQKTFEDENYLMSPNDVVGIDANRFYFSNDHGSTTPLSRKLEEYLQLQKSNIGYFDGQNYQFVADGIAMANGINLSHDGQEVYVAATLGKSLIVYSRDPSTGELSNRVDIDLNTGVDNIELDEAGNLWIGCHPKLLTFVKHSRDTSRQSPSQILKLSKTGPNGFRTGEFTTEEILLDSGKTISGSAVGAVSGNLLLVGPVMDSKILWCELSADK